MTAQERDFEEILGRVLHSATDQIEPVGDGLTKIRARLTEPWLKRQWWLLRSEFTVLGWLVVVRCEAFFSTVRDGSAVTTDPAGDPGAPLGAGAAPGAAGHRGRLGRLAPVLGGLMAWVSKGTRNVAAGGAQRSPGPVMNWLRPALAVAGAVVLVVAGVFALGQIRHGFVSLENASNGVGANSGNPQGAGAPVAGSRSGSPAPGRTSAPKPGASSRVKAAPSPSACSSASVPPISGPSPTPSPSPTPTPTPTPTTTPTPTISPTPSTSGAPMHPFKAVQGRAAPGARTTALVCGPPAPSSSPSNMATPPS
jgi:hypothetical protein